MKNNANYQTNPSAVAKRKPFTSHDLWLNKLNRYVELYMEDDMLSNAFLARKMNVSESHFYRILKEKTGKSPNIYIRELRLHHAKIMLESGKYKRISTVAYQIGFKRVDYFSKLFLLEFGVRPKTLIPEK